MHYLALATDYDGTLAKDGVVAPAVRAALERLAASGRKLILVTGRELEDLERVFEHLEIFDRVVAENGALLCTPVGRVIEPLAAKPPAALVERLAQSGVAPLSVGRVIVATRRSHEQAVAEVIRQLGLNLEVIANKDSLMVLPAGVDKASGFERALADLRLRPEAVVGVGDAENDAPFLRLCGCAVAVENALDSLKHEADLVTRGARGDGVIELAERLLADDLPACRTLADRPTGLPNRSRNRSS